ncbi:putative tRNA-dihydrouridine synthase 2 [Alphaproteobacteria bacterium]|nr:putative tRNA-dihydrouridine synthase 2 [Alphaproteobacteria bacterium]
MNFWNSLPKPFFVLAPMEDVTDVVFRQVVARAARPDVFFTEFMNVSGFCHPDGRESVARRLQTSPTDTPIVAQIWGSKPEKFSLTARELARIGFAGIDINMGCPDKSVVKSGGGSALIASSELAVEIIKAVQNSTDLPVSVKTRLGYSKVDEWRDWLKILLEQDLDALTVHLRTRKEMSKVPAHYELIPGIIKLRDGIAPKTKLIINGDIANRSAGAALIEKYPGIDGIMIGRGVFANPYCFEKTPIKHSREDLMDLLKHHLDLFDKNTITYFQKSGTVPIKYKPLKKFFKIYINNFPGASDLRARLMATKTAAEAREILDSAGA